MESNPDIEIEFITPNDNLASLEKFSGTISETDSLVLPLLCLYPFELTGHPFNYRSLLEMNRLCLESIGSAASNFGQRHGVICKLLWEDTDLISSDFRRHVLFLIAVFNLPFAIKIRLLGKNSDLVFLKRGFFRSGIHELCSASNHESVIFYLQDFADFLKHKVYISKRERDRWSMNSCAAFKALCGRYNLISSQCSAGLHFLFDMILDNRIRRPQVRKIHEMV